MGQQRIYNSIDSFKNPKILIQEEDKKLINPLPKLQLTQEQRARELPISVNNAQNAYFPWPFYQTGLECGQSTSITQIFSYETCLKRGWTDVNYNNDHKFPSHFVWNFCNGGENAGVVFLESWRVVKTAGTPNINDWGGNSYSGQHRKWMSGYDKYYRGMHNRISEVSVIPIDTEEGVLTLKHWLHNHLEGNIVGGLANFNATFKYPDATIPLGFPGEGKAIITSFTDKPDHAYTIIGYNDTIGWDYNGDHQLTNNIDINNDGKVDIRDWEKGCFIITHTSGPEWGDFGQTYVPYSIMATDYHQNGIWASSAFVVKVKEEVKPQLTLKSTITHNKRGRLKISIGVSTDTNATVPSFIYEPYVFHYQGGDYYMQGGDLESDKRLEFGIDLSPLLDHIEPNIPAKFFYIVNEKDEDGTGIGTIDQYSLVDYTNGEANEIESGITHQSILDNRNTTLSIIHTLHFSKPIITDSIIECTINEPIEFLLHAENGVPNYRWEFSKTYNVEPVVLDYPSGGTNIFFNDIDEGYASIELPFKFPYYKDGFFKVFLFANGYIAFAQQDIYLFMDEDLTKLQTTKMIAPFLADLQIVSAKQIWGTQSITFLIKAKLKSQQNSEISYSVTLSQDGKITFQYGNIKYVGAPFYAGISNGDGELVLWSPSHGKKDNQLRYTSHLFTPPSSIEGLSLSSEGIITGRLFKEQQSSVWVNCYDNNDLRAKQQITLNCFNPSELTLTNFDWNDEECVMVQRGCMESIGFTAQNFSSSSRQDAVLNYSISNHYITIDQNSIELGTFTPGQAKLFEDGFRFMTDQNIPEHEIIDIEWCIVVFQDTLSRGVYSFYIEDPDLEILGYDFKPSELHQDQFQLKTQIQNIQNCASQNLTFQLILLGTGYNPILAENSIQQLDGHQSEFVHFIIKDPKKLLLSEDYTCQLSIYANGVLIRKKEFTLYHDFTIIANPNPTANYIEVSSSNPMINIDKIQIYNTIGGLMFDSKFNNNQVILDLSTYKQGIYILKVKSEKSDIRTFKIVKI